jgi:hypothetical protein
MRKRTHGEENEIKYHEEVEFQEKYFYLLLTHINKNVSILAILYQKNHLLNTNEF